MRGTRSARRREDILEAALACFLEGGEAAVTIEAISSRSGASVGSIYHHFGSKEGVLANLFEAAVEDYRAGLWRRLDEAATAEQAVKAVVRHHLEWMARHPERARLLHTARWSESLRGRREDLRRGTADMLRRLRERFRPYMEAGEIVRLPPALYPPLLVGPAQELARQWLRGRTPGLDLEAAAEPLAEAAWRSLRSER